MELKLPKLVLPREKSPAFNRTFMELKRDKPDGMAQKMHAF